MKKRMMIIAIIIIVSGCSETWLFADNSLKALNPEKIADDLKFNNAVEFVRLERYNEALRELGEYIEIYYDGNHRYEAYNEIARIYFRRFDYLKALSVYRSLYEEFSSDDEGIEACYMTGICYLKMGYDKQAREVFEEIIREHPGSDAAGRSQLQIDLSVILEEK